MEQIALQVWRDVIHGPDGLEEAIVEKLAGACADVELRMNLRGVRLAAVKMAIAQMVSDPRKRKAICRELEKGIQHIAHLRPQVQLYEETIRTADAKALAEAIGKTFAAQCNLPDSEDFALAGSAMFVAIFQGSTLQQWCFSKITETPFCEMRHLAVPPGK